MVAGIRTSTFLVAAVAMSTSVGQAAVIIDNDSPTTGSIVQSLVGAPGNSTTGVSTNLPGTSWGVSNPFNDGNPSYYTVNWFGAWLQGKDFVKQFQSITLGMGAYNTGELAVSGSFAFSFGTGAGAGILGFAPAPAGAGVTQMYGVQVSAASAGANASLSLLANGVVVGTPVATSTAISNQTQYTLSYSVDTATGALTDVVFAGQSYSLPVTAAFTATNTANFGYGDRSSGNNGVSGVDYFKIESVPEPTSLALLGFGGLTLLRRRHAAS